MPSCPLCQQHDLAVISKKDRQSKALETQLCKSCGTVFNNPIPSDEELAKFYTKDYRKSYKSVAVPKKKHSLRAFKRAQGFFDSNKERLAKVETCLDVGAGGGEFLYLAKQRGWQAQGIEPNEGYANSAKEFYDVDIFCGMMSDTDYAENSFDLIRLNHVLEHINDPVSFLAQLRNWLKDDGLLYVEVPNIKAYAALRTKGKIFHYGHIFNFSPWALQGCGKLAGFDLADDGPAESTALFFTKGEAGEAGDLVNSANYDDVKACLDRHYSGAARPFSSRITKPLKKLVRHIKEFGKERRYKDRHSIGQDFSD